MAITRPDFDNITSDDLQQLIEAGATESQVLEFKRDRYGNADADRRELLKDVSSLANAHGGHLVIGIEAVEGVASRMPGFVGENAEAEVLRLDSIVRTGLEPPIIGLRVRTVQIAGGSSCIVIRVPQSWNVPHRVAYQHSNKFFIRHSASADEASMNELRSLFAYGTSAIERVRAFHQQRIAAIIGDGGARPLVGGGRLIAHFAPLASFMSRLEVDLAKVQAAHQDFRPISSEGFNPRFNFDGFVNERGGDQNFGYTQVFRNGVVEACKGAIVFDGQVGRTVAALYLERGLLDALVAYLRAMRGLDVPAPIVVLISLEGVRGVHYQPREQVGLYVEGAPVFDRDVLTLPEVVLEDYGSDNDHERQMIPAFTSLWNAMRWPRDEYFDDAGAWVGQRRRG